MKRMLPDSLGGWVFTVVVAAVILLYGSTLITFVIFRDESAAAAAAGQAANQLIVHKRILENATGREQSILLRGLNSPSLRMVMTSRPLVDESDDVFTSRIVYNRLRDEFPPGTDIRTDSRIAESVGEERFPTPDEVRRDLRRRMREQGDGPPPPPDMMPGNAPAPPEFEPSRRSRESLEAQERVLTIDRALREIRGFQPFVRASVQVGPDMWFNARVDLNLTESSRRNRPFVLTTVITLLIAGMAIWAVRRATMPVSLFAVAAERLGIGLNAEPLPETGTGEVRRAARAFNTMQSRLKRFIQDRTQMLAAISHDLRTPITRMRLRAEFVDDDEQRTKMLADLDEMEAMIKATLAFAKDDPANEAAEPADVAQLVQGIVSDLKDSGAAVTYDGPDSLPQAVRPMGFKRALTNLIENAVKYGDTADVKLEKGESHTVITIDDAGPGIAEEEREQVFTPFYRIEGSRSRDTGGTGLGMTIARNAVRSMGGDIELINRAEGGLRVKVTLPLQG